jgi:hypothetical protein
LGCAGFQFCRALFQCSRRMFSPRSLTIFICKYIIMGRNDTGKMDYLTENGMEKIKTVKEYRNVLSR